MKSNTMLSTIVKRQGLSYHVVATQSENYPGKYSFTVEVDDCLAVQWVGCGQYETPQEALREGIRHAREDKATWRELISDEMALRGETWGDLVAITLSDDELDQEFLDLTWWGLYGLPFTAWSANYVYFPVSSEDCSEYVRSVPRHPNGEATKHIGGYLEAYQ